MRAMTLRELLLAHDIDPNVVLRTPVGMPELPQPGRITVSVTIEASEMRLEIGVHLKGENA